MKNAILSDKYLAGFLDSDGSIFLQMPRAGRTRPQLGITWSQKEEQDSVIHLIHETLKGSLLRTQVVNGNNYTSCGFYGKKAVAFLNRIEKYLVLKRHYAHACCEFANQLIPVASNKEFKVWLKSQRKVKSLPLPNFPSRKWLAGYLDGDGCFSISHMTVSSSARLILHVACSDYDTEGIEIIQKSFSGRINKMKGRHGYVKQYQLDLQPSKAKEFLGYFAKHMVVKRDQVEFILSCAEMGHFRDGKNIKAILKQLKVHPHRLNMPKIDLGNLLSQVRDLPHKWNKKGDKACKACGETKCEHVAFGLCSKCYTAYIKFLHQSK